MFFKKHEPLQHFKRRMKPKVVNSSLAPPLDSVFDNSGVQRERPIYDLLLPTLFGQVEPFMMNCAILYH